MREVLARLSAAGKVANYSGSGLPFVRMMSAILDKEDGPRAVLAKFAGIADWLSTHGTVSRMMLTATEADMPVLHTQASAFLASVAPPSSSYSSLPSLFSEADWAAPLSESEAQTFPRTNAELMAEAQGAPAPNSYFALPLQVNYCAMGFNTGVGYLHADAPALGVVCSLVSSLYCHAEVREKGGAYGGGCQLTGGGQVVFYSYRDPRRLETIHTFRGSAAWLADPSSYTDGDVNDFIISSFAGIDAPVSMSARGGSLFLRNLTNEQRQAFRERLLAVTRADVERVAAQYFTQDTLDAAPVCIVGSDANLEDQIVDGWEMLQQNEASVL
jgi:Zn-dependent M16 (insulinase) family peptidase